MPLRSLHRLPVLYEWVLKRGKSALAGPLYLIWVMERQSGPHCHCYMPSNHSQPRLTAAVKQGVTPHNSASSSEKPSPAVISNGENRIVTAIPRRNRLTCTAYYFVQWRSCRGEVRVILFLTDNRISLSSRSEQEGQNIYSSRWLKIIIAREIWKRPGCIVVPAGASASPRLLLAGESFVRFCQTLFMFSRVKGCFCCFALKDLHNPSFPLESSVMVATKKRLIIW